ncbi:MAG TPA: ABC transporter ATP-binding protein [Nitrolancea sp.]|jgi:putative ABC transport system ATP-binding protein|nr:ABC transporter ATP-binding protein [Nitrolancea sp.]
MFHRQRRKPPGDLPPSITALTHREPVVQAAGLSKTYRSGSVTVDALRDIDVRVEPGELVAIMGPSGCGKTTLLNCLAGLEGDFRGDVWINGVALRRLSDRARARLRARSTGFIFQTFNLLPTLNVVENVEMPLLITGKRGGEARRRALEFLDAVGLSNRVNHRPSALSGGQQQRVAIARALVNQPAIVFADEPTGNLDSDSASQVMDLIQRLNADHGQAFVIVTHSPEIAATARRTIHMHDGRIASDHSERPEWIPTPLSDLDAAAGS